MLGDVEREPEGLSRRALLRWSASAGAVAITAAGVSCAAPTDDAAADANGVITLAGFTSRVIARAGEPIAETGLSYRGFPDGAATFADPENPGGWYLTINHEIPAVGGVTSIRFAPDGTIVDAYDICADTSMNCAGGPTPWGTWLTCEEHDGGFVWECDPTGTRPAEVRRAMGAFAHEAAAVASDDRVYLTEDRADGGFYRFTPDRPGDLGAGLLEVACNPAGIDSDRMADGTRHTVTWRPVPRPVSTWDDPCRRQVEDMVRFDGGEGIATDGTTVWFTTKGDDRVWEYDLGAATVRMRYQAGSPDLSGLDNLWFDRDSGALFVAEDGGEMRVVNLRPDNTTQTVVRLPGQDHSEITGPCFSPDGRRLYFSSQRGPVGLFGLVLGVTYEITGPFDELLGRRAGLTG